MDYTLFICAIASFIETRVRGEIDYGELEKSTGFSYRHIRETFRECTGRTLSRYIRERRLCVAAFDITHSDMSLTKIGYDYNFKDYNTFSRAFKRYVGMSPTEFRASSMKVGRRRIFFNVFAPVIYFKGKGDIQTSIIKGVDIIAKDIKRTDSSCILYGVPKVSYTMEGLTPFTVSLKSVLNYMGQKVSYSYLMAASGAAFRLRWNTEYWDGGNVDIMNIYEDMYKAFKRSFRAVGREFEILKREDSNKDGFINFIKKEIDAGRPVIALGIIGPPEACVITGYRDDGKTLLGWNCFQNQSELNDGFTIDECGYFVCDSWWENKETKAIMSIGEQEHSLITDGELVKEALSILTTETIDIKQPSGKMNHYAGGQKAYDKWAEAIGDNKEFGDGLVMPLLMERLMCQNDAEVMIGEGRYHAGEYFTKLGSDNEDIVDLCDNAVKLLKKIADAPHLMGKAKNGYDHTEEVMKQFAKANTRKKLVEIILSSKRLEAEAIAVIEEIYKRLDV